MSKTWGRWAVWTEGVRGPGVHLRKTHKTPQFSPLPQGPPPWPLSQGPLTVTHGPSVLTVMTVMLAPGPRRAEAQGRLVSPTAKIVQEDGSSPLPEEGASRRSQRAPAAQLAAGHRGVP